MKAKHFTFLFMIFILSISCEELRRKLCKDTALSLERVDYTGKELRIDGFYYAKSKIDFRGHILDKDINLYETFVFYRNGILLQTGSKEFDKMEFEIEGLSKTTLPQQSKDVWGVFNINGNDITIEHWLVSACGYPSLLRTGKILNDSTFVLNKMLMRDRRERKETDINQEFHFRHFDIKPDSINKFIK